MDEAERQFLAKAEEVLTRHAETYRAEIPAVILKMDALAQEIETVDSEEALATLKRMAHDMRGQGAMFGLPDFATVATSLSLLLSKGDRKHAHYKAALNFHIDVLKRLQSEPSDLQVIAQAQHETELVLKDMP
jgi:chemotaxis protein histidine kinase CheA